MMQKDATRIHLRGHDSWTELAKYQARTSSTGPSCLVALVKISSLRSPAVNRFEPVMTSALH